MLVGMFVLLTRTHVRVYHER